MEQFIILVVIGLISLVNWLLEKSAERKKQLELERKAAEGAGNADLDWGREEPSYIPPVLPIPPVPSRTSSPSSSPAEQGMRELYEALGVPMPEELPPPMPVKSVKEPVKEPPPLVMAQSAPMRKQAVPSPVVFEEGPAKREKKPSNFQEMKEAAARFAKSQEAENAKSEGGRGSVRERLLTPANLRDAIVLREILGPPKALDS